MVFISLSVRVRNSFPHEHNDSPVCSYLLLKIFKLKPFMPACIYVFWTYGVLHSSISWTTELLVNMCVKGT